MAENPPRIKFYGVSDMSTGLLLAEAEPILAALDLSIPITDINNALELNNIIEMFRTEAKLPRWTEQQYLCIKDKTLLIPSLLGRFYSTINNENIAVIFSMVDEDYIDDFWSMFSYYNLSKRISNQAIASLLDNDLFYLRPLFKYKNIVDAYPEQLTTFLNSSVKNAEMLIDAFLLFRQFAPDNPFFFPSVFNPEMREELVKNYINWPDANINYLNLIYEARDNINLPLSVKVKHAALIQYESMSRKLFSAHSDSGINLSCEIWIDPEQEEPVIEDLNSSRKPRIKYSQKWIDNNLDFPTLWNNFLYVFNFVDYQCRSQFVANPNRQSVISKSIGTRGKTAYFLDLSAQFINKRYNSTLKIYMNLLQTHNICIEGMLTWFFNVYLPNEFNAIGFFFNPPSSNTTKLEKCKLLATELDSLIKQFETFVIEGAIDRDLFEFNSESVKIKDVRSLIPIKYFYASSDDCRACMHYLFSDQSTLNFTKKRRKDANNFYELLIREDVRKTDFHHFNITQLNYLITQDCVYESATMALKLNNKKTDILFDLYYNNVCSTSYFDSYKQELDKLHSSGDIRYSSTLLSEPEQDYFSYILTKSTFSNGLDLRNKYVHGNYPINEEQNELDYYELLKLLIVVILKINEEFCLREDLAELSKEKN